MPDSLQVCTGCGAEFPAEALECPSCRRLVHAEELSRLAREAREAERLSPAAAAEIWKRALALLPPESKQAGFIAGYIQELESRTGATPGTPAQDHSRPKWQGWGGAGVGVLILLLSKGKFLLLGLTKMKTLLSMLAFLGVYWTAYGWRFALGFVLGIYIHEMGHVWALKHYGLRASSPMFIPGFGAFISLYDPPANAGQDSRIGLAGPAFGLGSAALCWVVSALTGDMMWRAIAHTLAVMNLFNLVPVWQLDGGRGLRCLARSQRWQLLAVAAAVWIVSSEGLMILVLGGLLYRLLWAKDPAPEPDRQALLYFASLVVALGVISTMSTPTAAEAERLQAALLRLIAWS